VTDDSRTSMIGPVGSAVIGNIERIRAARGISLTALSERLGAAGRPIGGTVLHRQSQGKRRVDADDLVAFAEVLGVTVADLLEPPPASGPPGEQPRMPEADPVARNLIEAVESLRQARGLSYRKLSAAMEEAGRPILTSALHAIVHGKRAVSAAELAAFATVFGVAPEELLAGPGGVPADHPAILAARSLASRVADLVAVAGDPQATERAGGQADRAMRRVQIEIEELIAAAGSQP
jgi:transcriptional regulator with XRE-family HTH domain